MSKQDYPLFPQISIQRKFVSEKYDAVRITSAVRVLHNDGLWYQVFVKEEFMIPSDGQIDEPVENFIRNTYLAQHFTSINPDTMTDIRTPLFRPDKDQRTEKQRLLEDVVRRV